MIGGIFAVVYCFDEYQLLKKYGGIFFLCLLGIPTLTFFIYRYIKHREQEHHHFRIDAVDDVSGEIKFSLFDEKQNTWKAQIIHPIEKYNSENNTNKDHQS